MSVRSRDKKPDAVPIPSVIFDADRKRKYTLGKCIGKGGFAKCFEVRDEEGRLLAGKIVAKALLQKKIQKEKMSQEITLHKRMVHKHVVRLISYFQDANFVYIILELCSRRSLMELHKRRRAITEPETRYYLRQILCGVQYVHNEKIIHRDLKLGNIFLNEDMEVKLGDFGLATELTEDGERKRTLCGTPNYIAPEVLTKKGHGFEVDVWSIGCILYTLLVGKPPFETETLNDTYARIRKCEYAIPEFVSSSAATLIRRTLQYDPDKRPTVDEILADPFFTSGYMPIRLPVSCLTTAPRFDAQTCAREAKKYQDENGPISNHARQMDNKENRRMPLSEVNTGVPGVKANDPRSGDAHRRQQRSENCHFQLVELHKQLEDVLKSNPSAKPESKYEEAESPRDAPMIWISKWVDYSDKYGFGYTLNDDSIGVLFNDVTKLLLLSDGLNVHYIDEDENEHYMTMKKYPSAMEKKIKLLNYFRHYMSEHLLKAGADMHVPRDGDELSRIPAMKTWFRTSRAVVMHLTNGTVQINFFNDHTKVILCPLLGAVTYIDEEKRSTVYNFELIKKFGCDAQLLSRLSYAAVKIENLIKNNSPGQTGQTAAT